MKAFGYIREGTFERAEMELNKASNLTSQQTVSGLAVWNSMFNVTVIEMQQLRFTTRDIKRYLKQQSQYGFMWNEFPENTQEFLLVTSILESIDQKVCEVLLENGESLGYLKILERKGFLYKTLQVEIPITATILCSPLPCNINF